MPGPSTVPIDSREWMRPMIGESVDVIENLFVRSEGGKGVWAGVLSLIHI